MQHYKIHCNGLIHMEQVALLESDYAEQKSVSSVCVSVHFALIFSLFLGVFTVVHLLGYCK